MIVRLVRLALIVVGCGFLWYGATLLWDSGADALRSIAVWFAAGILLHDGVFAPVCIALGLGGRRWLPYRWWAPVACGAVCTVALAAVAAPVLGRGGAVANPTVLDRNYPLGFALAVALVWILVALAVVGSRAHPTGRAGRR
ncbi:MAG TPA: hypothetical protein VIW24_17660 [Aldersonia sp.]